MVWVLLANYDLGQTGWAKSTQTKFHCWFSRGKYLAGLLDHLDAAARALAELLLGSPEHACGPP